jgi:hypothetical protein
MKDVIIGLNRPAAAAIGRARARQVHSLLCTFIAETDDALGSKPLNPEIDETASASFQQTLVRIKCHDRDPVRLKARTRSSRRAGEIKQSRGAF